MHKSLGLLHHLVLLLPPIFGLHVNNPMSFFWMYALLPASLTSSQEAELCCKLLDIVSSWSSMHASPPCHPQHIPDQPKNKATIKSSLSMIVLLCSPSISPNFRFWPSAIKWLGKINFYDDWWRGADVLMAVSKRDNDYCGRRTMVEISPIYPLRFPVPIGEVLWSSLSLRSYLQPAAHPTSSAATFMKPALQRCLSSLSCHRPLALLLASAYFGLWVGAMHDV